jgi:hypothetical protein
VAAAQADSVLVPDLALPLEPITQLQLALVVVVELNPEGHVTAPQDQILYLAQLLLLAAVWEEEMNLPETVAMAVLAEAAVAALLVIQLAALAIPRL